MVAVITRRRMMQLSAASLAALGIGLPRSVLGAVDDPLTELTLTDAATAIRNGDVTSLALAEAYIKRISALESLNTFVGFNADKVREAAAAADARQASGEPLGPLHGVPIALKDNIDTVGYITQAGTPGLHVDPTADAPVAAALLAAGAIIIGKNTMHEMAFGATSNNAAFGAVRNPYNPDMIPGGSSGGTAASVAARLAAAGIGSDTGGSVRVPASLCGLFGLRPTLLRWSQEGIFPIAATRDTAGPIGRSFKDLALLDGVVTGSSLDIEDVDLSGLRLGVPKGYFWEGLDPDVQKFCEEAIASLQERGVTLVEADIPNVAELDQAVSFVVALYEPTVDIPAYLEAHGNPTTLKEIASKVVSPDVHATINAIIDPATAVPEEAYRKAIDQDRPRLIDAYKTYFSSNQVDAVIFPTVPLTARPIGDDETVAFGEKRVPTFTTFIRNCDPGSNAGIPGITLPIGLSGEGLPIGLALDGPAGSDRRLLAIGEAISELFDTLPAPK